VRREWPRAGGRASRAYSSAPRHSTAKAERVVAELALRVAIQAVAVVEPRRVDEDRGHAVGDALLDESDRVAVRTRRARWPAVPRAVGSRCRDTSAARSSRDARAARAPAAARRTRRPARRSSRTARLGVTIRTSSVWTREVLTGANGANGALVLGALVLWVLSVLRAGALAAARSRVSRACAALPGASPALRALPASRELQEASGAAGVFRR
jgi:hypothetical protein